MTALSYSALKSNGTLLPLPALYRLAPPWNGLGFGSMLSSVNRHLLSLTTYLTPPPPPLVGDVMAPALAVVLARVGEGLAAPLCDSV